MNNIFKSALLFVLGAGLFTACSDDRDSNPTLESPTSFVLNTPAVAGQTLDLANAQTIDFTCSQPDYGFPANVAYKVQVSLDKDMNDSIEIAETFTFGQMNVPANTLASTLTTLQLNAGKTEADFPLQAPAYVRVRAYVQTSDNQPVKGTEVFSNIVKLSNIDLAFSLPPVEIPTTVYTSSDDTWNTATDMVPVNGAAGVFWRLMWIGSNDDEGFWFNTAKDPASGVTGYSKINATGDLASEITAGGNDRIVSTKGAWYLVIVTNSVEGRNLVYDVQFNKPDVYLMGSVIGDDKWSELNPNGLFTIPDTKDGDFVSPKFTAVPAADSGVRAYVKVPGFDWWKSEFIVLNGKIAYRGNGGDQERVSGQVGQQLYLNFAKGTGEIK